MTKVPSVPLWVCTDCILVHANGECGELPEGSPEPLSLFTAEDEPTAGLLWEEHEEGCPNRTADGWVEECQCETNPFSWSPCDGCGSALGGERHAMCVWITPGT